MTVWYVGAILAILASVGTNLGINIQKYSFLNNSKKPKNEQKPYIKQPGWALGLGLVIFGSVGDFAALALAAQSIVAPIGSVTLVANIIFAHFWLKESLSRRDFLGTVLIIAGSVLTVAFGDHSSPKYSLDEFLDFFAQTSCYGYAISLTVACILLYTLIRVAQPIKRELGAYEQSFEQIKSESERNAAREADTEYQACEARYKKFKRLLPFSYCCLSGVLGAQSVLFGKLVGGLISTTFQGDNQLVSPYPYIFLFAMLAFIFAQLHFLALALQLFDALYCVPMFQCFFITISTIGGAAFFQEFQHFTTLQYVMFPLGIFVTLSGVGLLAQRDTSSVSPGTNKARFIIPASTATFFLDLAVEKTSLAKLHRSQSHNSLPDTTTGKTKVQLEKAAVENEANAAATLTLAGGMKLPDHVEQSVREISMNHESSYAHSSRTSPHRANRNTMSSFRAPVRQQTTQTRLKKQPSHHQRAESTQPGHVVMQPATPDRDSVSITVNDDQNRARRKAKSRSHPTHWPQGSNAASIAQSLAPSAAVSRADTSTGLHFHPASPSALSQSISYSNHLDVTNAEIPMTTLDRSRSEDPEGTDRCRVPSARYNKHNANKLGAMHQLADGSLPCHQEECDEEPVSILDTQQSVNESAVDPSGPLLSKEKQLTARPSAGRNILPPLSDAPQ